MAAIDKLYLKYWYEFEELITWCIVHKSSMLFNFHSWIRSYDDWNDNKETIYNEHKKIYDRDKDKCESIDSVIAHYKEQGYNCPLEQAEVEYNYFQKEKKKLANKEEYLNNLEIPVANFTVKQDKYLLWHCNLYCIREYLETQRGYKIRWYHKVVQKLTNLFD